MSKSLALKQAQNANKNMDLVYKKFQHFKYNKNSYSKTPIEPELLDIIERTVSSVGVLATAIENICIGGD